MTRLTQSLLTLARVEAAPERDPAQVVDVTARGGRGDGGGRERPRAWSSAIEIEPDLVAEGDPVLLRQVMLGLLSNACAYTPAPGTVTLRASRGAENTVTIEVKDTGKGIPTEEQDRVFDRFYRGSGMLEGEGFGLGLSIAKRMVNVMGGEIGLIPSPGRGARSGCAYAPPSRPPPRSHEPDSARRESHPRRRRRALGPRVGRLRPRAGGLRGHAGGERGGGGGADHRRQLRPADPRHHDAGQERARPLPRGPRAQPRPDHPADRQGRRGRQGGRPRGRRRRLRHEAVLGSRAARPRAGAAAAPRARPLGRHRRERRDQGRPGVRSTWRGIWSRFAGSRPT